MYIDDSNRIIWLFFGIEDFFLFVYYFDKGFYYFDNVGLIYLDKNGFGFVSVYKFFENDLLLFIKFFEFWWRCSDRDFSRDKFYGCLNIWFDFIFFRSE